MMSRFENGIDRGLESFVSDGRPPVQDLYASYFELARSGGWVVDKIYDQVVSLNGRTSSLPVLSFRTKVKGPSVYLISGIHGEEPAGPIALARSVAFLKGMQKQGYALVVLPLCNARGYTMNWRYPNAPRLTGGGKAYSVGDMRHCLLDASMHPRREAPAGPEPAKLGRYICSLDRSYPCQISLDFHEDESLNNPYIYSQGKLGVRDPVARRVIETMLRQKFALTTKGTTSFGEPIVDGIVDCKNDGSVDELSAANRYRRNGSILSKHPAESVVVIETPALLETLDRRVRLHMDVIRQVADFIPISERYV